MSETGDLIRALSALRAELAKAGGGGRDPASPKRDEAPAAKAPKETEEFSANDFAAKVRADYARRASEQAVLQSLSLGLSDAEKRAAADRLRAAQDRANAEKRTEAGQLRADQERANAAARRRQEQSRELRRTGAEVGNRAKSAIATPLRAVGVNSAIDLARLAMGYRGMAQLQAITLRAQFQFRRLFKDVDSGPAVRAAATFFRQFDSTSVAGRAMSGMFTRTFNSLFSWLERAEPKVTEFFQGMVLGALYAEGAYLRLRIALYPLTAALESSGDAAGGWIEKATGLPPLGWAGAAAIGALGLAAAGAAAPFLAAAAAIGALYTEYKKLKEVWNDDSFKEIQKQWWRTTGQLKPEDEERAIQDKAAANTPRSPEEIAAGKRAREAWNKANGLGDAAGEKTGEALAQGVAEGISAGETAVADAAGKLVKTADGAMRRAGEIRSPSGLTRRTGKELPAGAVQGIESGAGDVQRAAERSLIPSMPSGSPSANATGAKGSAIQLTVINQWPAGVDGAKRREVEEAAEVGVWRAVRAAAQQLGIDVVAA